MALSIEKLRAVQEIVVHAHCADGIASALILRDVLPRARVRFLQYDSKEHRELEPVPGMLFCDFSPHINNVYAFAKAGAIVLDHHKTQREVVKVFGDNGFYADETLNPGVSGAKLAYQEVWRRVALHENAVFLPSPVEALFIETFADIVGVYDTWQRQDSRWERSRQLTEMLHFYPFETWPSVGLFSHSMQPFWDDRTRVGEILVIKKDDRVQQAVANGYRFTSHRGTRVILFEGVSETSDAAELLGSTVDLVVGFKYVVEENKAQLRYSTRSHTHFNCSAFAKHFGGGGHTKAAGFAVKDVCCEASPFRSFEKLLRDYEDSLQHASRAQDSVG
jgi:oligoribonuclease NrnB/cAMP/cGMP phosphodiesterase (DHH superfamily)